jgi:AICAR transformylase/IMP cyclohydrolase PurH
LAVKGELTIALASGLSHQRRFRQRLREDEKSLGDSILVFDEDIEDPDLLSEVKELGVTVVVHPGTASSREGELVDRANQLGLALVATGVSFTNF